MVHVVSPAEFYLQLKEQFAAVDAVQEQVAAYAGQPVPGAPPPAGHAVAALYPDDGVWYRGRVIEGAGGKVSRGRRWGERRRGLLVGAREQGRGARENTVLVILCSSESQLYHENNAYLLLDNFGVIT